MADDRPDDSENHDENDTADESYNENETADEQVTTDHAHIRAVADERDIVPAYLSDEPPSSGVSPALVRREELDEGEEPRSWDEFFEDFEAENLAFAYREEVPEGESRYDLIDRDADDSEARQRSEQDRPTTESAEEPAPEPGPAEERPRATAPDETMADESGAATADQTPAETAGADPEELSDDERETASAAGRGAVADEPTVDATDVGKPVLSEEGTELGVVADAAAEKNVAYVDPVPTLPDDVMVQLGWDDESETHLLDGDRIAEVTDEAVWVWVADR